MDSSKPQSKIVKYFLSTDWLTEELIEEIYGAAPVAADLESNTVNSSSSKCNISCEKIFKNICWASHIYELQAIGPICWAICIELECEPIPGNIQQPQGTAGRNQLKSQLEIRKSGNNAISTPINVV